MAENEFKCQNCGAAVEFKPGADSLVCPYCGTENEIEAGEPDEVEELDFEQFLKNAESSQETEDIIAVTCETCGAEITLEKNVTSDECPFCASLIHAQEHSKKAIKPRSLLSFKVSDSSAKDEFAKWVKSRWFAPNKLKHYAKIGKMSGVYMPFWTYDSKTTSQYSGSRGEYYYTSETYTTTVNGKTVTRTRQVRRTRWYPASGTVYNTFDDVLVLGSKSLPRKYAEELEPWDLQNLTPHSDEYIQGFKVESYSVDLEEGFADAREKMKPVIRERVRRDIGGDTQRIHSINTRYDDVTFKHILLPVWISAYHFRQKLFRILVNARTGEVQGERPWSWVKISLASAAVIALIAVIVFFAMQR